MITPRTTRLVRTPGLAAFRDALVTLACDGGPFDVRDRLVVVPTRAAASHLVRSIERRRLGDDGALLLPDFVTPAELPDRFAARIPYSGPVLTAAEREVLLGRAAREAREAGVDPPFQLRPGLIGEMLAFYDDLRRNLIDLDLFERRALMELEPGAEHDRGAGRLVRQTRFLVAAFHAFERHCAETGAADEHALRRLVRERAAERPWRYVVLAVHDVAFDVHGLRAADWDLLTRVPGLARLDLVVTDGSLAGEPHERLHQQLPGVEEVRWDIPPPVEPVEPVLRIPPRGDRHYWVARDREEEVVGFAAWARHAVRTGEVATPDDLALVVRRPLPYVYITREVLRSAGVACQTYDALPLAAEPYAAALDLVFACVDTNVSRTAGIALLRSPHFRFTDGEAGLRPGSVSALDRALSEAGYLGGLDVLERTVAAWRGRSGMHDVQARALPAAGVLLEVARSLSPLREAAPPAQHLDTLLTFLQAHASLPGPDDPLRTRQLRARAAIAGMLTALRDAYRRFDERPVEFDEVAALARRWIDAHTFAPRSGESGVHLVDAESARFGDFAHVQLAGLVDGEWPDRGRRNIFYSPGILRQLGWPADSDRLAGAKAAFADLLRLPSRRLSVSSFTLEHDVVVAESTFLDDVEAAGLDAVEAVEPSRRIFEYEALGLDPVDLRMFDDGTRGWATHRLGAGPGADPRFRGATAPPAPRPYSLSALERYQDCPFKFFARDILRLEESPEDEVALSPRARGRFLHEVFQDFFEAWDRGHGGAITPARLDDAQVLFRQIADVHLALLPSADAALERARLLGSAVAVGVADVVLEIEATSQDVVRERLLEYRFEGAFTLGDPAGRLVTLKGVTDRIDLLEGNRLRVVDYKSGQAPTVKRALQVPIYALCAVELLTRRDGRPWSVDEAAYVAFGARRPLVPVVKPDAKDAGETLGAARDRLHDTLDGIGRGAFPIQPYDTLFCGSCAYAPVCRKDYVGGD